MRLSVIVPQYKETVEQIRPLLDSVYNQVGIDRKDFEVVICNDGVPEYKPDADKLKEMYPGMNIRVLVNPVNGGCGPARQWGIDHSDADFITCADADDQYISCFALVNMLEAIEGKEADEPDRDMVMAPWTEEQIIKGNYIYVPHMNDGTWMHGKIYRRSFLVGKNVRFHPDFRIAEDGYFNTFAMALGHCSKIEASPIYLWKWHENSTTRADNAEYSYSSLIPYMKQKDVAFTELCNRKAMAVCKYIVDHIIYVYLCMNTRGWNTPERKEQKKEVWALLGQFMRKYHQIWTNTPRAAWEMEWKQYTAIPQFGKKKIDGLFTLLEAYKAHAKT